MGFIFLLDSLQTALSTYNLWFMLVSGWGNGAVVFITPWDLCLAVILTGISLYKRVSNMNLVLISGSEKFPPLCNCTSPIECGC